MSNVTVALVRTDASATALIRHERSTSKVRYANYIADHAVTLETVPAHVQALADLAGEVKAWATPAERKAFCTKIRNGLKHHLTPADETVEEAAPVADETGEGEGDETGAVSAPATDPLDVIRRAVVAAREAGLDEVAIREAVAAALV